MLLLPRSYDQFVGKAAILQSWSQFGSIVRPPSVVAADTAIWKVLFAATKGGDGPSATCGPPDEFDSVLNPLVKGFSATVGTVLAPSVENSSSQAESSECAEVTAALAPADGVTPLRPADGPSDEPFDGMVGTSGCPASPITAGDTALLPLHRSPELDATSLDEALPASAMSAGSDVDMSSGLTDAPPSRSSSLPVVVK
ncbi:hypothetical protein LshimejAT787_0706000 [Lyophyllum shimeji]|uniref:Uncharacterized protein n=1 Tax=Lyophyllum shimeji TaxID=47721 RepID=A0A9P3UQE4_LYOSH|nr:hypothetical protein LshimejAT787_0706000 [Lyophyllum shimeji]